MEVVNERRANRTLWLCVLDMRLWVFVLLLGWSQVKCFNVDIENYVKHRGARGSMFGFTVAEHRDRGASWILVGAPEAHTSQVGVTRGGAVYRCDVGRDDSCQQVPFDTIGNSNSSGHQIDQKSNQWFGATLQSSGEDGVVVACAPRYVWYSTNRNRRDPVGTCYTARNSFTETAEYSPCRTRNWGHHRQGFCQAGMGAAVSKDNQRLFIGAPGAWYWQGQLISVDTNARLHYIPIRERGLREGQLSSQNLHKRPEVVYTKESTPEDDDSYLGYSVAVGDFTGSGEGGVAVGMPRGAGLVGKVLLYTRGLDNDQNITGEQLGAYFAYSMCVVDVDGDKLDDIVVGAPLYTDLSNNEGKYETGRVYVFYQGGSFLSKFRTFNTRDGTNSKSRFGLSLTSLGDINKDGFGDFAVGAPYDGPQERGAVYIYHGSTGGVREKFSQVVYAEDVSTGMTTFGFSVAGGIDLDENEYPDMVVGAYEADTAFFLRSRPVVNMITSMSFLSETKLIALQDKNCTLRDSTKVSCLSFKACLEYRGVGVERKLDFEVQFVLDSKKPKSPRMYFMMDEGRNVKNYTLKLDRGSPFCRNFVVYIKSGIRDKLSSLEAEMKYSLKTAAGGRGGTVSTGNRRRISRSLTPIMDMNQVQGARDSVNIQKNCGSDNVCIPDLNLIAQPSVLHYLLGSGRRFEIDVKVQNEGEDAFEAVYNLHLPPGMNYINIERPDKTGREVPVQCSAPSPATNNTLKCDIGNPLPAKRLVHFKVLLQPFHRQGMKPRYEFYMDINSTNPELKGTLGNNKRHFSIPIQVETELTIEGTSRPVDCFYNLSYYSVLNATKESEIGPQLVHVYTIRNKGPSDIVEAEAFVLWPSYTLAGDDLLYLLEQPETEGPIKCDLVEEANALNIKLDENIKSYIGVSSSESSHRGSTSHTSTSSGGITVEESSSRGSSSSSSSSSTSGGSSTSSSFNSSYSAGGGVTQGTGVSSEAGVRVTGGGSGVVTAINRGHTYTDEERRRLEAEERDYAERGGALSGGRNVAGTHWATEDERRRAGEAGFRWSGGEGGRTYHVNRQDTLTEEERRRYEEEEREFHRQWGTGGGGNRSYSSSNYSTTWTEDGQPTRHFTRYNYSDSEGARVHLTSGDAGNFSGGHGGSHHWSSESSNRSSNAGGGHHGGTGSTYHTSFSETGSDRERGASTGTWSERDNVDMRTSDRGSTGHRTHFDWGNEEHASRGYDADTRYGGSSGSRHDDGTAARTTHRQGGSAAGSSSHREQTSGSGGTGFSSSSADNHGQYGQQFGVVRGEGFDADGRRDGGVRHYGADVVFGEEQQNLGDNDGRSRQGETRQTSYHGDNDGRSRQGETRQTSYHGDNDGRSRQGHGDNVGWQHSSSETSHHQSSSSENVLTDGFRVYDRFDHQRARRAVGDAELARMLQCNVTTCIRIRCVVGPIGKDQEAILAFRSRVNIQTLKKIGAGRQLNVSSLMAARVTRVPHLGEPDYVILKTKEIMTDLKQTDTPLKHDIVPLWVVVLSACAGALILLLLVFLLWKCGFFKRNRPSDAPEREPLNRNGHYSPGDEAL